MEVGIDPLLLFSVLSLFGQTLAHCPAPFSLIEAGKCVFVNTAQSYTWCSANQQCASIGGELINSYDTLRQIGSLTSLNCGCNLWFGMSDTAEERNISRSGWQMINNKGILPLDDSLWLNSDPNNRGGNQDCVGNNAKLLDLQCSSQRGFACEFAAAPSVASKSLTSVAWKQTPFKRTHYNLNTEYCYTDLPHVRSAMHCLEAAMRAGNNRNALYNSKMRTCRLLQFTDAQVEQEIETSPDWKKYNLN